MSWRSRLLLSAVVLSLLLTIIAPTFTRLELSSYDYRLRQARYVRGNLVPSVRQVMFGVKSETLTRRPDWTARDTEEAYRLAKEAGAAAIWVDPNLKPEWLAGSQLVAPLPYTVDEDNVVREVTLADAETSALSPSLKLYAELQGVPAEEVIVSEDIVQVGERRLPRVLPVDFPPQGGLLGETDSASKNFLEPLSIHLLFDTGRGGLGNAEYVLRRLPDSAVLLAQHTQEARTRHATPVGDLEAHQLEYAALDTLLSGWVLRRLPWVATLLVALPVSLLFAWLAFSRTVLLTLLLWSATAALYWFGAIRLFALGWALPVVPVLAGSLLSATIVAAVQQFRAYRMMARLLGDERAAAAARGEAELGGRERIVTILFTNLPQEIQALEQVDPEASIRARNRYCEYLTEGVKKFGGWVLDYQGDFQMAGFGVEKLDPEHALHATQAGLELCRSLGAHYPDESIHCGICTGPAAVGLVGAPSAKALAAIGDTTNVAARLLGAAKKQGVPVLISEPTHELCGERLRATKLPAVDLKGKTSKVEVYSVEGER